mmetsp:Transcript_23676/g.53844  ORF Transcript_23676/g.53844 Transcript_23676/m.53844 type:complete len:206 (+) Transcript_23676:1085-1702(+)
MTVRPPPRDTFCSSMPNQLKVAALHWYPSHSSARSFTSSHLPRRSNARRQAANDPAEKEHKCLVNNSVRLSRGYLAHSRSVAPTHMAWYLTGTTESSASISATRCSRSRRAAAPSVEPVLSANSPSGLATDTAAAMFCATPLMPAQVTLWRERKLRALATRAAMLSARRTNATALSDTRDVAGPKVPGSTTMHWLTSLTMTPLAS